MRFDVAQPIWVQLVAEFRRRIAVGEWPPASRVPSVRELAVELGVNPNTVQRAFAELDRIGLTASERTAGRFVTPDHASPAALREDEATSLVDTLVASLKGLGLSGDEALLLLSQRWSHDKEKQ